jgi:uncharacterized RmlC-like cupin family protein
MGRRPVSEMREVTERCSDMPEKDQVNALRRVRANELSASTASTPGMRRLEAISGKMTGSDRIWLGVNFVEPGARSADHHHGDSETGIYVVSGHPVFVFGQGGAEVRLETGPGDFVFVPPFVPHREENPSPEEPAEVVLARSSQEAIVVNLPSLFDAGESPDEPTAKPIIASSAG